MEVFDKNGKKIELLTDESIEMIDINAASGYELVYNYSYRLGNSIFFIFAIKKLNGFFEKTDNQVANIDFDSIRMAVSFCGLSNDSWSVKEIGYFFTNANRKMVISDKVSNAPRYNYAFVNSVALVME